MRQKENQKVRMAWKKISELKACTRHLLRASHRRRDSIRKARSAAANALQDAGQENRTKKRSWNYGEEGASALLEGTASLSSMVGPGVSQ